MADLDQKPGGKSDRRKQKRKKKAEQKAEQTAVQNAGKPHGPAVAASEPIAAAVRSHAPEHAVAIEAVLEAPLPEVAVPKPMESAPVLGPAPAELAARVASFRDRMASVVPPAEHAHSSPPAPAEARAAPSPAAAPAAGILAIANAYRDYTRKSLEDAQTFAEKLSAARSFDKAMEAQAEFARQACETFADNSRKIRELHRELFWQAFRLPTRPAGRSR